MSKKEAVEIINNLEINRSDDKIIATIDPKIYSMAVIFSAAYVFIDKNYVVITGDPDKEVFVEIKPKEKEDDLEGIGRNFNNELLNYAVYYYQSEVNKDVRNVIVQKTLFSGNNNDCGCDDDNISYKDDPLGIAKPWSEDKEGNSN